MRTLLRASHPRPPIHAEPLPRTLWPLAISPRRRRRRRRHSFQLPPPPPPPPPAPPPTAFNSPPPPRLLLRRVGWASMLRWRLRS